MNVRSLPSAKKNVNPTDAKKPIDCVEIQEQNADRYTILRAYEPAGKVLEFVDGEWRKQKGVRKTFFHDVDTFEARDLNAVYRRLRCSTAHAVFIHGLPRPGVENVVRRLNVNFAETPHNIFMLDFDKIGILSNERGQVVIDPAECARIVRARMTPEFHDAAMIWNATSGHGLEGGKARLRLIAWTSRPINLAEAKAWAIRQNLDADLSIYRKTQPVFLAPPTIATEGMQDPVRERWGMLDGKAAVDVPADLHAAVAKEHERLTTVAPGCVVDAPHMLERFVLSDLKPRNADRIGESGRHMSIFNAANDAFDLGLSRDLASALLNLWFDHENGDAFFNAIEQLSAILPPKQAEGVARDVRACGAAIGEAWNGDAMDESDVEKMIDDAITSRSSPHGCKFEKQLGDAFGAVEQDDDDGTTFAKIEAIRCAFNRVEMADDAALDAMRDALVQDGMDREAADVYRLAVRGVPEADMITGEADDLLNRILAKAEKARGKATKPEPEKPGRLSFTMFDEAADAAFDEVERQLVKDMLDLGAMSVLYGESNTGKSFVALLLAFHIAAGRAFAGREVEQGLVVYIVAEGGRRFDRRLAALRSKYPDAKGIPLAVVKSSVDLHGNDKDVKEIARIVREAEAATGRKALLVIVDTLARAMGAGSENEARDMNALVTNGDKVRAQTGAHLMYIHHSGKDRAKGARGHSSLRAATDTEIEVVSDGAGLRSMTVTKQRDMETGDVFNFRLVDVTLGSDKDGNARKSAVAEIVDTTTLQARKAAQPTGPKLSPGENEAFDVIKRLAQANGGPIAMAAIRDAMNEGRKADAGDGEFAEVKGNYLRKLRSALIAAGVIREGEPGHVLLAAADDASAGFSMVDDE